MFQVTLAISNGVNVCVTAALGKATVDKDVTSEQRAALLAAVGDCGALDSLQRGPLVVGVPHNVAAVLASCMCHNTFRLC